MFVTKKHLSRRTFLTGVGVTVALPLLESMVPAQTPQRLTAANRKDSPGVSRDGARKRGKHAVRHRQELLDAEDGGDRFRVWHDSRAS